MSRSFTRRFAAILLIFSLIAWPLIFTGYTATAAQAYLSLGLLGPVWLFLFAVIVSAIAWIPPIAASVDRALSQVQNTTQKHAGWFALLAALASATYLALTAANGHRSRFPVMHDEFSYLIQAHQIASGHLWMPHHPLAPFFDSFQLLVHTVYASAYFPGTAILYVPGIWLHLQPYVTSIIISGAVAGLFFWITIELLGGLNAWLATLLLLGDSVFRQLSVMTLSQLPLLLCTLTAITAWRRWQKTGTTRSAVLTGFSLSCAALTRPVDALCFALPIGFAMLFNANRRALLIVSTAALPLLVCQVGINRGITGHWSQTPFGLYADRDYPGTSYGFHLFNAGAQPVSDLPQKKLLYNSYRESIERHTPANILADTFGWRLRLFLAQQSPVPYPLLVMLCPLSLLAMTRQRAVVLSSFPLLLIFYAAYAFFMQHYVMVAAPAVILSILTAVDATTNLSIEHRYGDRAESVG